MCDKEQHIYQFQKTRRTMAQTISHVEIPQSSCKECVRKCSLITKYLHLIELLKKKNEKSNRSTTIILNKNSLMQGATISQTPSELSSLSYARMKILEVLCKMEQARKWQGFRSIQKGRRDFKLPLLLIVHHYKKTAQKSAFDKLKHLTSDKFKLQNVEEIRIQQKYRESQLLTNNDKRAIINTNKHSNSNLQALLSTINCTLQKSSKIQQQDTLKSYGGLSRNFVKENLIYTLESHSLKQRIRTLEKELQENIRRQFKESQKKKESLQMLAEDIAEKNEIIAELQNLVKCYESKVDKSDKVLDDQFQIMRKQVQTLTRVNQKLQFQISKVNQKNSALTLRNIEIEKEVTELSKENQLLKLKVFQLKNIEMRHQNMGQQLQQRISAYDSKLEYLKIYQLKLNEKSRVMGTIQILGGEDYAINKIEIKKILSQPQQATPRLQFGKLIKSSKSTTLEEVTNDQKINAVFNYLKQCSNLNTINIEQLQFSCYDLFNEQQKQIINDHINLLKGQRSVSSLAKEVIEENTFGGRRLMKISKLSIEDMHNNIQKVPTNDDSDQICHNEEDAFDSVLDVMDSPSTQLHNHSRGLCKVKECPDEENQQQQRNNDLRGTIRREPKENLTMKLLQMEIEKSNLIQRISDLKNKHLHIRNMVYNLLKSLRLSQINIPLRNETLGVLQVMFDVFQYSEEEKEEIFSSKKKKKFFGFFD